MPTVWRRLDRFDLLATFLLLVFIPAIFGPLLNHLVRGTSNGAPYTDYPAHNAFAAEIRQERKVVMPHPLYHWALIGIQTIARPFTNSAPEPNARAAIEAAGKEMQGTALATLNRQYAFASVVTLLAFLVLLGLILWAQIRAEMEIRTWRGVLLAMPLIAGLMLAAPVALLHGVDDKFYFGYIGINVWHSPTVLVARPFALLTFVGVLAVFDRRLARFNSRLWIIALVVVLGALAKPSFLIALLPAVVLVAGYRTIVSREFVGWGVLLGAILVPAALVLAWQARVYAALTGGSHAKFSPWTTMGSMSDYLAIKFALSVLFPTVCYIAFFSEARRRFRLNLAWLAFLFGLGFTYLVAETRRTAHGNFLWSAQLALFVLFVESALFVLKSPRSQPTDQRSAKVKGAFCAMALAAHVGFGIWYYAHLLATPSTIPLSYK